MAQSSIELVLDTGATKVVNNQYFTIGIGSYSGSGFRGTMTITFKDVASSSGQAQIPDSQYYFRLRDNTFSALQASYGFLPVNFVYPTQGAPIFVYLTSPDNYITSFTTDTEGWTGTINNAARPNEVLFGYTAEANPVNPEQNVDLVWNYTSSAGKGVKEFQQYNGAWWSALKVYPTPSFGDTQTIFRGGNPASRYRAIDSDGVAQYFTNQNDNIYFDVLSPDRISIGVVSSFEGNVVTFTNNTNLDVEYSLNGIDWFTNNQLTGQPQGDYTLYVRDQFGVIVTKDYSLTGRQSRELYMYVAPQNTVDFVTVEDTEPDNRNPYNSLDCKESHHLNGVSYPGIIQLKNTDTAVIQLKSTNYRDQIKVRKEDGTFYDIPFDEKSNNLDLYQSYDTILFPKNGFYNMRWTSGNIYDVSGNIIGTHDLNGNLPDFARRGNYIKVNNATSSGDLFATITDLYFDVELNSRVAILTTSSQAPISIASYKVECYYDLLPYNVKEATVNLSVLGSDNIDMLVESRITDNDVTYQPQLQSPAIELLDTVPDSVEIVYWSDNNKSVFYKYGIKHIMRPILLNKYYGAKQESVINISDDKSYVAESSLYDVDVFEFGEMPRSQAVRLVIALSSDNVFINEVGYVKEGDISIDPVEGTNLSKVTANMLESNVKYTNLTQSETGNDAGSVPFDVPKIITDGTNFIKS